MRMQSSSIVELLRRFYNLMEYLMMAFLLPQFFSPADKFRPLYKQEINDKTEKNSVMRHLQ